MKNLLRSFNQRILQPNRQVSIGKALVFTVVSLIGFADATYLTVKHFLHQIPPCTIQGCETVLTSSYSVVLGMPVSLLGAIFYAAVAVLSIVYIDTKKPQSLNALLFITHLGLIASLWFVFLQAFVIHAWCQYCLASAATSAILWVYARWIVRKTKGSVVANPAM